jgi:hypothetical protein
LHRAAASNEARAVPPARSRKGVALAGIVTREIKNARRRKKLAATDA